MSQFLDPAHLSLFGCLKDLTDTEAQQFLRRASRRTAAAGTVIFDQDEDGDSVCLLISGQVEIGLHVQGQPDQVLIVLEPGSYFGEVALLLDNARTARAVAVTEVEVWELTAQEFLAALDQQECWAVRLLLELSRTLAHRLGTVLDKLSGLLTDPESSPTPPRSELLALRERLLTEWTF